jgi:hypothetical protein
VAARRRKVGIGLFVLLLVVVGLLVAVDRVGAAAAENLIADQAAKEMTARHISTAQRPDVSVGGFPFLTQVLAGRYDKVTIRLKEPATDRVKLESLTMTAAPVHAPLRTITSHQGQVTADVVTGTATLTWAEVTKLLEVAGAPGIDPSSVELNVVDNQIRLRIPFAARGFEGAITATGSLAVTGGKVRVNLTNVAAEGANVPPLVTQLIKSATKNVTLSLNIPNMPYDMKVNKVETTATGIVATASADHVRLAG